MGSFLFSCKPEAPSDLPNSKDPWAETYTEMNYSMGGIPYSEAFNPIIENGKLESTQLIAAIVMCIQPI